MRITTYSPSLTFLLAMIVVLAACSDDASYDVDNPSGNLVLASGADNEWITLFDGESLGHWRGFRRDDVPSGWQIEEGTLAFVPGSGEGGDIVTRDRFENFELELEWKISEGGNSGIFYRVQEGDYRHTWETGPEMQVLDDAGHRDGLTAEHTAGSNYALHAPSADVTEPVGEWNTVRLVVDGARVEHWLNGVKIVEFEQWSEDWQALVDASKFATMSGYGAYREGHIALQDHGDRVWYRNIRIRPLP
jgi:hypothetical protein